MRSNLGLQLLNVLVTVMLFPSSLYYDTDHESVNNTVALRLFNWERQLELTSLASLHAPQFRASITCTTVMMKLREQMHQRVIDNDAAVFAWFLCFVIPCLRSLSHGEWVSSPNIMQMS